jgi:uncharacterized protein YdhG (YjbR/CyaY superfamily)
MNSILKKSGVILWRRMRKKEKLQNIDEYTKIFPEDVQIILEKIRQTIQKAAPEAVETISYGIPTFKLKGKDLVYFAAWKNHIGFYPMPSAANASKKELSEYKQGKGSIQFPLDKPIPYDLIKNIVIFRVRESSSSHL